MKHYFISCLINGQPEIFETLNLSGTLQKLTRWAVSGFRIESVSIRISC